MSSCFPLTVRSSSAPLCPSASACPLVCLPLLESLSNVGPRLMFFNVLLLLLFCCFYNKSDLKPVCVQRLSRKTQLQAFLSDLIQLMKNKPNVPSETFSAGLSVRRVRLIWVGVFFFLLYIQQVHMIIGLINKDGRHLSVCWDSGRGDVHRCRRKRASRRENSPVFSLSHFISRSSSSR